MTATGVDTNRTEQQVLTGSCTWHGKPYRAQIFISGYDEGMIEIWRNSQWQWLRSWQSRQHFTPDDQVAYDEWVTPKSPDWDLVGREYELDRQVYQKHERGSAVSHGRTFVAARVHFSTTRFPDYWESVYLWGGFRWHRAGDLVASRFKPEKDNEETT